MKRALRLSTVAFAAGLLVFGSRPASSQERPSPSPSGGSGEHASPPSGGGSSSSGSSSGGAGSVSPSGGGGSSVGSSGGGGGGGGDHAVSRGEGRHGGGPGGAAARTGSPRSVILPSGSTSRDPGDRGPFPGERRAPAYPSDHARSRGDRPTTGTAVNRPRDISNVPGIAWRQEPYWSSASWYPCYGWWGGYCYYDPFWWDYYYGYAPTYYGGDYYGAQGDYDTGSLKLKVKPRNAQVYVDGYFSGVVDDYDGTFQRLRLRAGAHRIELRAEGFQPAVFDVLIVEGETVTYRAELKLR